MFICLSQRHIVPLANPPTLLGWYVSRTKLRQKACSCQNLVGQFARIDSRFAKKLFFRESTFQKMDNSEARTRITRISMRIGEKTRFAQIWPSASKIGLFLRINSRESIRTNLRNVGVRITCPLTLRAQRLQKFKILKFSSEIQNFKRATHQTPIFCGEF